MLGTFWKALVLLISLAQVMNIFIFSVFQYAALSPISRCQDFIGRVECFICGMLFRNKAICSVISDDTFYLKN